MPQEEHRAYTLIKLNTFAKKCNSNKKRRINKHSNQTNTDALIYPKYFKVKRNTIHSYNEHQNRPHSFKVIQTSGPNCVTIEQSTINAHTHPTI